MKLIILDSHGILLETQIDNLQALGEYFKVIAVKHYVIYPIASIVILYT